MSVEEALRWNYDVNDELLHKLLDIIEDGFKENPRIVERQLSPDELAVIGRGLHDIVRGVSGVSPATNVRIDGLVASIQQEIERYFQPASPEQRMGGNTNPTAVDGGGEGEVRGEERRH